MIPPGWFIWCVLLTGCSSACGLEISGYDSHEVICSQGLSGCTMRDKMPLMGEENNGVDVQNLTPHVKLCCRDKTPCALCLVIDTEIYIHLDVDMRDEDHSGHDEDDYSEETERSPKASVTVCYSSAPTMPSCKKVEFMVNHTALTQKNKAKFSMVINKPVGVSFSSHVIVYSSKPSRLSREVDVPSLDEVCSHDLQRRVQECRVPTLDTIINQERNQVELQFADSSKGVPSVCIQYERNGICQRWSRTSIPLYSVTPCMCLQVWNEDEQRRSVSCPFTNSESLQRNMRQNVSMSVDLGQMNNGGHMLLWNLSAPCRLEGEVWLCHKESSCVELQGFRQQLANGTWRQNSKGLWEKTGVYEEIDLQVSPCVMVKIKGMGPELGPFCLTNTDRWRWSLLVVALMLLLCLTLLLFYLLHDFVKKWVWSCHHGGFVKIVRKGHVVLLSPPEVDDAVSESVCRLGTQLYEQGFRVAVDQWSSKEQCTLGPLPWLYSQLQELNSLDGRVVLVLTHKALERTEEWSHRCKEAERTKGEDGGCSPYSVFTASLYLIQADKQLPKAGRRFILVTFDPHLSSDRRLPELLQGLPLFQLPSQTQALFSELMVGRTGRGSGRRTWTGWSSSDGWRAKTKEGADQQNALQCKSVEKTEETSPLKHS